MLFYTSTPPPSGPLTPDAAVAMMAVEGEEPLGNRFDRGKNSSVSASIGNDDDRGNQRTLIGPLRVMIIPPATVNQVRVYVISLNSHSTHV